MHDPQRPESESNSAGEGLNPSGPAPYFPGTEPEPEPDDRPTAEFDDPTPRPGVFRFRLWQAKPSLDQAVEGPMNGGEAAPDRRSRWAFPGLGRSRSADAPEDPEAEEGSTRVPRRRLAIGSALGGDGRFETRVGLATLLSFIVLVSALYVSSRSKRAQPDPKSKDVELAHGGPAEGRPPARPVGKPDSIRRGPGAPPIASKPDDVASNPSEIVPVPSEIRPPIAAPVESSREISPPLPSSPIVPPAEKVEGVASNLDRPSGSVLRDHKDDVAGLAEPPNAGGPPTASTPPHSVSIESGSAASAPVSTGGQVVAGPESTTSASKSPEPVVVEPPPRPEPTEVVAEPVATPSTPPREIPKAVVDDGGWVALPNLGKHYRPKDGPIARPEALAEPGRKVEEATPIEPVRHVAAEGEDFAAISRKYYGSGRYAKALWSANKAKVATMDDLVAGTVVGVPPLEALDARLVDPADPGSDSATTGREPRPGARVDPDASRVVDRPSDGFTILPVGRPSMIREATQRAQSESEEDSDGRRPSPRVPTYVALRNDTFRSIARKTLGDSSRAEEIRRLNLDIVDDPYRPQPGQKLKLPMDAKVAR